jgi:membrane peptidoglycan carboxypeptidase
MVGSVDYNSLDARIKGQFNVATAPSRSLGSSFKPIVYATAFQMGWYPGTIIPDAPTCFPNDASDQTFNDQYLCPNNYLPHSYERQNWSGKIPAFVDLGNSLNTPAELAFEFDGARANYTSTLYNMALRLGIDTLDPRQLGPATALGAQGVPLLEETSAYGTFANHGYRYPPRSVLTVTTPLGDPIIDDNGNIIFKYEAVPSHGGYQAISPEASYMVTSILTENNWRVGDFGPDNPLYFPNRQVAAKTGTSQGVVDIVTEGYTPSLAVGVWAGNTDNSPMDQHILGIAGAGYIFHDVMNYAIQRLHMPGGSQSVKEKSSSQGGFFPIPPDMHLALVSCHTGLAPYAGEDVTQGCDPGKNPVPEQQSVEFDGCDANCADGVASLTMNRQWYGLGWGSKKCESSDCVYGELYPGVDSTWMINGQDPLVP